MTREERLRVLSACARNLLLTRQTVFGVAAALADIAPGDDEIRAALDADEAAMCRLIARLEQLTDQLDPAGRPS